METLQPALEKATFSAYTKIPMSLFFDLSLVLAGIALLYGGGELLVRGAVVLARALGVSTWVIGITVVSAATSMPELAATLLSFFRGVPSLGLGNVVGSNIANIGLILGTTAMVAPIHPEARAFLREIPFMIALSLLMVFTALTGFHLVRLEGLGLFLVGIGYLAFLMSERDPRILEEFEEEFGWTGRGSLAVLQVAGGVVLLVGGSHALVEGGVGLARALGVSERIIGLTLVSVGTSLPELASTLVAALKDESDIALGNVVGSNIFNIASVLGIAVLLHPVAVDPDMITDFLTMMGFSLLLYLLARTHLIQRWHGGMMLGLYSLYIVFLFR